MLRCLILNFLSPTNFLLNLRFLNRNVSDFSFCPLLLSLQLYIILVLHLLLVKIHFILLFFLNYLFLNNFSIILLFKHYLLFIILALKIIKLFLGLIVNMLVNSSFQIYVNLFFNTIMSEVNILLDFLLNLFQFLSI